MHTIDNNLPIYDRNIAYILKLLNQSSGSLEEKIKNRINIYSELKNNFALLLDNTKIKKELNNLRGEIFKAAKLDNFDWNDNYVSDAKLLDFFLWSLFDFVKEVKS